MSKALTVKEGVQYLLENSGKHSYKEKSECVWKFLKKFPHMPRNFSECVVHHVTKEYMYDRYTLCDYDGEWFVRLAVFQHEGKLMINELKSDCFNPKKGITNEVALKLLNKYYTAYDGVDHTAQMSDDFGVWKKYSKQSDDALRLRSTVEYLLVEETEHDAENYDYINKMIIELTK